MTESNIGYICNTFLYLYGQRHGEQKVDAIMNKVAGSNKVRQLLMESKYYRQRPSVTAFTQAIISSRHFVVCSRETEALATVLAILRWQNEVNTNFSLADNEQLKEMGLEVLRYCKQYELVAYFQTTFDEIKEAQEEWQREEEQKAKKQSQPQLTRPEKLTVLACFLLLVWSCKRKFREEEKKALNSLLKAFGLDKGDMETIRSIAMDGHDGIVSGLCSIYRSDKPFFISKLHLFFHLADDMPAEKIEMVEFILSCLEVERVDIGYFINNKVLDEGRLEMMF